MRTPFFRKLFATTMLSGASVFGGLSAHALTHNSAPVVDSITPNSADDRCTIVVNYDITADTDDSFGDDFFRLGLLGQKNGVPNAFQSNQPLDSLQVGQTQTIGVAYTFAETAIISDVQAFTYRALEAAFDVNGSLTITQLPLTSVSTRNDLMAAGGVCARIAENMAPIANAGTDLLGLTGGAAASLNAGASSDGDGDPITYFWTQTGGPSVTLSDPTSVAPSFTLPPTVNVAQDLTFELIVSDAAESSTPDTVFLQVASGPNTVPTAVAGADQSVAGGSVVTIDGSASSDPDPDTLSYDWVQVSGPTITLSDPASAVTTFTAPASTGVDQIIVLELRVDDSQGTGTGSDQIQITVLGNQAPISNAGSDISTSGRAVSGLAIARL